MKTLVLCPSCKWRDNPVILGSIDEDGNYFVILSHNRSIKVLGDNYGVFCGSCGELIHFKEKAKLLQVKVKTFDPVMFGTMGTA